MGCHFLSQQVVMFSNTTQRIWRLARGSSWEIMRLALLYTQCALIISTWLVPLLFWQEESERRARPCLAVLHSLQSIRGDETVNVNKPSPVSAQLTARSGQSAQLVQRTHCIRTYVNLHSDFGHPCNGTPITWSLHDFILRAKKIARAFVYDDFLVSANGL
jgi:hypothetical protein